MGDGNEVGGEQPSNPGIPWVLDAAVASERERRTLHRISQIALAGHPLDEAYNRITDELEAATGFSMSAIVLYDAARKRLVFKGTRGLPSVPGGADVDVGLEESLAGVVVRTGEPLVWTDADPLPVRLHATLGAMGARTFVGVPMTVDGRVIGAVTFADRHPRTIDGRLVEFAASIANHVALLAERAHTLEALRASERHFRAVFDAALDAMIVLDDSRRYVAANPAAARLIGLPVEELLTHRFGDFATPETDVEGTWAALRSGHLRVAESRLQRPDGVVRDVESSITANFLPGRHLAVVRDVTDRKHADTERRVRSAALTAAADGIVITDAEGRIEWVNPEFTRMTGYALDEVRGQTPRMLKSGQHAAGFYADLWTTIRAGRVWRGEMANRRQDGTVYLEEQSITPVRANGPGERITHFVAVKQDISARKRAEQALRQSEEYHRSLTEHALDLTVVLDADGVFRYASPSVERVLGERPQDLVGTNALPRLHPDDLAAVSALFFGGQQTPGLTASAAYRFRHRDGSWRHLEGVGRNLLDHPAVAGIIVNARDVTERKSEEATQERLRAHLRQSEKLAAMSELLAGVAHELNNPLSVVIGHTTLLARISDPAVAARAEKIGRAAERCGRIVKNFLALARQYPPERTSVNLNQVVRDALEMVAYPLRVDNVDVVTELAETPPALSADGHQLQQVLVNLVTNAHQAMRGATGARRLTVRTGWTAPAGPAWLEVADTGPGIPAEVEARLFEPFFTTKPLGQGTGLGLPICKGIVEGHGGRISVDGGPGRGAIFRVELPLGGPAAPPPATLDGGPVGPPRRVLVVDDEIEVARIVSEVLGGDGHEVDTAANGIEALEYIGRRSYDAVFSDVKMPRLDGPGLWASVTKLDPALAKRFVFFTGDTLSAVTAEFLDRVGMPSLRKPFAVRDIRIALASVPPPAAGA